MTSTQKVFHVDPKRMEAVVCRKDGRDCRFKGHNTDIAAVERAIERAMEPYLHVSVSKRHGPRYLPDNARSRL